MKKFSEILLLAFTSFMSATAIATPPSSIPPEASAATEAQQAAFEYQQEQKHKPESSAK